jgi:SAM-dependent methyltransferase
VSYNQREYWSAVAEEIRRRPTASLLAGDDSPFMRYKREAFVERMLTRLPVADKAVLEVGCGPGANLMTMAGRSPRRLVGCDISSKMIELAAETTAGAGVDLIESSDGRLPFGTNEFDISLTVTVLQHNHLDTVRRLVAEMARVTSQTLCLIEDTTTRRRDMGRFLGWITGGTVRPETYVLRRVSDYARIAETVGFKLSHVQPLDLYASDMMRVGVWLLDSRLVRSPTRREGAPLSPFQACAEKKMLPLTRRLDRHVRQRQGLTAMVFGAGWSF